MGGKTRPLPSQVQAPTQLWYVNILEPFEQKELERESLMPFSRHKITRNKNKQGLGVLLSG